MIKAFLIVLAVLFTGFLFMAVKTWPRRGKPAVPRRRGISVSARGSVHITSNAEGTWVESEGGFGHAIIDGEEVTLSPNEKKFIPRR